MPAPAPAPRMADITPIVSSHPLSRELVADDAKGKRENGPACALNDATDEHHGQGRGQRADQRPHAQGDEHGHDDSLFADHVADPAQDRRGDRGTEQIGGQQPAGPVLRGVQRVLELGYGRDDQRLQQAEGQRGGREDRKGESVAGVFTRHWFHWWILSGTLGSGRVAYAGKAERARSEWWTAFDSVWAIKNRTTTSTETASRFSTSRRPTDPASRCSILVERPTTTRSACSEHATSVSTRVASPLALTKLTSTPSASARRATSAANSSAIWSHAATAAG